MPKTSLSARPEPRLADRVRSSLRARVAALFSSNRAADTHSVRVWLIRTVSLTFLLAGNALIQAAAMQPAIIDGTPEARRYSETLDGAVAYALLIAVLMVVSWRSRHDYWRVLVGVVLTVGGLAGVVYSLSLVPDPGPAGGMGLRGYLGAYAFACCALSGLVALCAYSGRGLFRPWKVIASAMIAGVGIVGLVSIAELWFPPIVAAANIKAVTTPEPPPEPTTPRLDGSTSWVSTPLTDTDAQWYDTIGGLLGTTTHGVTMLDPTTGEVRWSYDRYDVVRIGTPRMAVDGEEVAVTSVRSTTASVLRRARSAQYVWVFDTATGTLLSERLAPSISASLRAYTDGLLIWANDPEEDGRERGWLGATDPHTGDLVWQLELPQFCGTGSVRPLAESGPALLVATRCWTSNAGDRQELPDRLLRIDARTGAIAWEWIAPTTGGFELAAPDATVDGVVPVLISKVSEPDVTLAGLDPATGVERWVRPEINLGLNPPWQATMILGTYVEPYDHVLTDAGGQLVLGSADGTTRTLKLAGVDLETGRLHKLADVPIDWPSSLARRTFGLPDGRLVVVSLELPNGDAAPPIPPREEETDDEVTSAEDSTDDSTNGEADGSGDTADGSGEDAEDEPDDFVPDRVTSVVVTTVDAASGRVRDRTRTELIWQRVQLFGTRAGLVLRYPAEDGTVLVGLR